MPVFDQIERNDPTPRSSTEGEFTFLNRVARPFWAQVRQLVEIWFEHYPAEHQLDLRNRLRSDRGQHRPAFFELYLHEALLRSGFTVTVHPTITGISAHPDFLAESQEFGVYVEATTVSDPHDDSPQARIILDALREIPSPNFYLDVNIEVESTDLPQLARLRHDVSEWLSNLDPDEVKRQIQAAAGSIYAVDPLIWDRPGWRINLAAIPKTAATATPEQPGETVGMVTIGEAGWLVDTRDRVLRTLSGKASRYGNLDRPFVVAVLILDPFASDTDIESALAGLLSSRGRLPGGFWSSGRHRNVSGILTATELAWWTVPRYAPILWLNPDARSPLEHLPWQAVRFAPNLADKTISRPRMAGFELFGLAADWPDGPPFG